jgi:hypothetical protein
MSYEKTSHYITPTRLMKSPTFYSTVKMLKTVSPEFKIVLPEATYLWVREHWREISPENVALCIEHSEYGIEFTWSVDEEFSKKVLDACITHFPKLASKSLQNEYIREETINKFIDINLTEKASKFGTFEEEQKRSGHGGNSDEFIECITGCLRNPKLKTYQLEMLWKLLRTDLHDIFLADFIESARLDIVPDYILLKFFEVRMRKDDGWRGGDRSAAIFRETIRRGLLISNDKARTVISSQPRPILKKEVILVSAPEAPKTFTKSKVVFDGRTYSITI